MKTTAKAEITAVKAEFLEDIIFEGRNQNYGAYNLRKSYNNHLNLSLLIVLSIAVAVVSLAFMHSLMAPPAIVETPIFKPFDIPSDIFITPPELPEQPAKRIAAPLTEKANDNAPFVATDDPVEEDQIMTQDEKIELTGGQDVPVAIPIEPPVTSAPQDLNQTYTEATVTTQALFAGGSVENFRKWLAKNIHYPDDAVSNDLNGKVILQFTIDKTGSICDIKVVRGIHPVIDQAAIRALKASPKWTAATLNGNAVKVSYYLPIAFCIIK